MATDIPKIQRIMAVGRAFTPSGPIDSLALFYGRGAQIQEVATAVVQRGRHVGLYGQRGVGKTSLASVLAELFDADDLPETRGVLATCNTESDYASIWRDLFRELEVVIDEPVTPENVRYAASRLDPPALIVIDELDRLADDDSLTLLADTIKSFSDHLVLSTLVLVGVADSLTGLIGEHESIVRNLAQIEMPRMSGRELAEIVEKGCERCRLAIRPDASEHIISLSQGLPHYTHLLALHAGTRVVENDRAEITRPDVEAAIPLAVNKHTLRDTYMRAVRSTRTGTLYPEVLLACALAPKNPLGFFTAGAIRDPLEVIAGRRIDIPAFARHLARFLEPERGSVLQREGEPRNYFYRFGDPILQQFVVLNGLSERLISDEQLVELRGRDQTTPIPGEYEASEPPQLF